MVLLLLIRAKALVLERVRVLLLLHLGQMAAQVARKDTNQQMLVELITTGRQGVDGPAAAPSANEVTA